MLMCQEIRLDLNFSTLVTNITGMWVGGMALFVIEAVFAFVFIVFLCNCTCERFQRQSCLSHAVKPIEMQDDSSSKAV